MSQLKIPVEALKQIACQECASIALVQLVTLRYYPGGLYSPVPLHVTEPLFRCADCGANVELPKKGGVTHE